MIQPTTAEAPAPVPSGALPTTPAVPGPGAPALPAAAPRAAAAGAPVWRWRPGSPRLHPPPPAAALGATAPACLWLAGWIGDRAEAARLAGRPGACPGDGDAELIAVLYARRGPAAAEVLTGPVAAVLWDPRVPRLVAFRDRLGEHPLFHARRGGELLVSPDAAALAAALGEAPKPDPEAVRDHLEGRPPRRGRSYLRGIHEVAPGHLLVAEDGRVEHRAYWQPGLRPLLRLGGDEEYGEALRELLGRVVGEAPADAPAGVMLSSGLDSTAVAAALRSLDPGRPLHAVRWIAPELSAADEDGGSAAVARRLALADLPVRADLAWPLRTGAAPPTGAAGPLVNPYHEVWEESFRRARERGLRLLFTGSTGDQLFGGNVFSYPDLLLTGRWLRLARELRLHRAGSATPLSRIVRGMLLAPLVRPWLPRRRHAHPVPWLGAELAALPPPSAPPRSLPRQALWALPGRAQRLRLLADPWVGRHSGMLREHAARHGIELRHPFMDHRLFDFAASLPTEQTFRAARRKIVVRTAYRHLLPAEIHAGWQKTYPTAIYDRGLRERETAKVWALLTGMRAAERGWVEPATLQAEYRRYLAGETSGGALWNALTLEVWLREHCER